MRLSSILLLLSIALGTTTPADAEDSLACSKLDRIERSSRSALNSLTSVQRAKRWHASDHTEDHSQLNLALSNLESDMLSLSDAIRSASRSCGRSEQSGLAGFPNFDKKALAVAAGVVLVAALIAANEDSGPNHANTAFPQDTTKKAFPSAPTAVAEEYTIPASMVAAVPTYTTVDRVGLSDELLLLLADIIGCQPVDILTLRWGKSNAPAGHNMWNTNWFTVGLSEDSELNSITVHADAEGSVSGIRCARHS